MSIFFKKISSIPISSLKSTNFQPSMEHYPKSNEDPKNRLLMFPFFQCTLIVNPYRYRIYFKQIYKGVSLNLVSFRYLTFLYI